MAHSDSRSLFKIFSVLSLVCVCASIYGMSADEAVLLKKDETIARAFAQAFVTEKDATAQWQLLVTFARESFELESSLPVKSEAYREQSLRTIEIPLSKKIVGSLLEMYKNLDPDFAVNGSNKADRFLSSFVTLACIVCSQLEGLKSDFQTKDPKGLFLHMRGLVQNLLVYAEQCKRLKIDVVGDMKKLVSLLLEIALTAEDPQTMERLMKKAAENQLAIAF